MKVINKRDYHINPIVPDWSHECDCVLCGSTVKLEPLDIHFDARLGGIRWNCVICAKNNKIDRQYITTEILNYTLRKSYSQNIKLGTFG